MHCADVQGGGVWPLGIFSLSFPPSNSFLICALLFYALLALYECDGLSFFHPFCSNVAGLFCLLQSPLFFLWYFLSEHGYASCLYPSPSLPFSCLHLLSVLSNTIWHIFFFHTWKVCPCSVLHSTICLIIIVFRGVMRVHNLSIETIEAHCIGLCLPFPFPTVLCHILAGLIHLTHISFSMLPFQYML